MNPVNQDEDHLRLLSIFHYVWGGLIGFVSCFALIHVLVGSVLATGIARQNGPPAWIGLIFVLAGGCALVLGGTMAALTIWAGRCLAQKRHYTFCLVIAVISCLSFPFGTALGVFTIIVLNRPSVRPLFAAQPISRISS